MRDDRRAASRIERGVAPLAAAVAAALGASIIDTAFAQDGVSEEVIVTASRRETTVRELPFNIHAMSGAVLEQQRIRDLAELARWVPGLTVVDQGGRAGNLMTVRGLNVTSLNATEFLDNTSGDNVQTYLGEIPLYVDLKMHDIERIEVLIGPQGTLYGAGTLGGAVRYIPRAPDATRFSMEFHGDAFGVAHGGTGLEGDFTVNVPLVDERVALRASLGWLDDPGFIDYPYLVREPGVSDPQPDRSDPAAVAANLWREEDANWEQTLSSRLALLVQPSDRWQATFNYYFQDQEAGGRTVNHRDAFGTGRYEAGHRFLEPNDRRNSLVSVEVVADLGFAELTSATGLSDYDEHGQRDQTDLLLDLSDAFDLGYHEFPSFAAYTRERVDERRTNQEVRLVSTGSGRWSWIGGIFYNDHEVDALSEEFTPGYPEFADLELPTGDLEYRQVTRARLTEQALFGEVTYALTDRWALTVGGRFFDYESELSITRDFPLDEFFGEPEANRASDDGFLGKLNASFDVSSDVLAYVTISEGYRIGGVNAIATCDPSLPPEVQGACAPSHQILVEPDRTTNYEIGVHSELGGGRVQLNASAYYIDWTDIQTLTRTEIGAALIVVNGGDARTRGIELAAAVDTDGPWSFRASYAYADAQLMDDVPGLVDEEDAFAGDRLAGTPEHQGSLHATYFRPLRNGLGLDVDYGLTFTSDVLTKVGMRANGERLGGYTLHSASVGIGDERWSARLYADNLLDKFAETGVREDPSFIRDINGFSSRRYFRNVLRPRTIGIEFRYRI